MKLILASGSPRRAKILEALGVDFTVVKSAAREVAYPDDPERTVRENALSKGAAVEGMHVLSADTIVWFAGRIYGKPRDLAEAKEFLRELSGNTHTVYTGVAFDGEVKVVTSGVKFKQLDERTIDEYVAKVNPLDRAGAYDIDTYGRSLVESYAGSFENIMGLPVEPLVEWGIADSASRMNHRGHAGRVTLPVLNRFEKFCPVESNMQNLTDGVSNENDSAIVRIRPTSQMSLAIE